MSDHVKSDLSSFLSGDMPESRRREIESHLSSCNSCRHALSKEKSALARTKRQALKNATHDRLPNLLLTRLGRQAGVAQRPDPTPWGWILVVVLIFIAGGWAARRRFAGGAALSATNGSTVTVPGSTATAAAFEVHQSSPSSVRAEGGAVDAAAPALSWSGPGSNIKESRVVVVRDRAKWETLWSEIGRPEPLPPVDFDRQVVVGLFAGEKPAATYAITFGAPQEGERVVTIPYKMETVPGGPSGEKPVHPYALTAVAQTSKRIRLTAE